MGNCLNSKINTTDGTISVESLSPLINMKRCDICSCGLRGKIIYTFIKSAEERNDIYYYCNKCGTSWPKITIGSR